METQKTRFLIFSDDQSMWEKYLYQASDKAGINIVVDIISPENYEDRANLIIASGDPCVMIGKFGTEFANKMTKLNAIYPVINIDEEYSVIIPTVIKNADIVTEVIKNFTKLTKNQ